jgi:hypothetical protein
MIARHQVDELAEGEASQVVTLYNAVQLRVLVLQAHHTRTSENNLQIGIAVITETQLLGPFGLFENLVDKQYTTSVLAELSCKVGNAVSLKIEIVHVDIQTLAVIDVKTLFGILKEESGLSDTTGTLDTNHAVTPVNLIHQDATNRCIYMLNQVPVCPKKSLHLV